MSTSRFNKHQGGRQEQDIRLYLRIVAKADRREGQKSHAWQGKQGLQNHGAAQQGTQLRAKNRQHGYQRILECMPIHHSPFPKSLRACGTHVVLPQHLQHVGPYHASSGRREA